MRKFLCLLVLVAFAGSAYAATDYAVGLKGDGEATGGNAFLSKKTSYTRGGNLTITWKMWTYDGVAGAPGSWSGPCFFGPTWIARPNDNYCETWTSIGSGITGWPQATAWWGNGVSDWDEVLEGFPFNDWFWIPWQDAGNGKSGFNAGHEYGAAFMAALSKATCLSSRVTLGNTGGHKLEFSDNAQTTWTEAYEHLDVADGGTGTVSGDNSATLFVAFGTRPGNKTLAVDDVLIQQNGSTVLTDGFDSGTLDTATWEVFGTTGHTQWSAGIVPTPAPTATATPTAVPPTATPTAVPPTATPTVAPTTEPPVELSTFEVE